MPKATGKVGELLSAGSSAAKKRPRSASVGIVKLKSAPAGPLNLQLNLNRKVLRKIAGKHKRMTLWIRVNMVLPSGLSKNGWANGERAPRDDHPRRQDRPLARHRSASTSWP